jgi:hypothetical protein
VRLQSPACTAQANDISTITYKVVTKKQTRNFADQRSLLCNFIFLGGNSKSGVGVSHCVRAVSRGRGDTCARNKRMRERCERCQMRKRGGAHPMEGWGTSVQTSHLVQDLYSPQVTAHLHIPGGSRPAESQQLQQTDICNNRHAQRSHQRRLGLA